jgi:hypothetical protein
VRALSESQPDKKVVAGLCRDCVVCEKKFLSGSGRRPWRCWEYTGIFCLGRLPLPISDGLDLFGDRGLPSSTLGSKAQTEGSSKSCASDIVASSLSSLVLAMDFNQLFCPRSGQACGEGEQESHLPRLHSVRRK